MVRYCGSILLLRLPFMKLLLSVRYSQKTENQLAYTFTTTKRGQVIASGYAPLQKLASKTTRLRICLGLMDVQYKLITNTQKQRYAHFRQTVALQLADWLGLDVNEFVFDCYPLADGLQWLAVCCSQQLLAKLLLIAKKYQLQLEQVDVNAIAILRAVTVCEKNLPPDFSILFQAPDRFLFFTVRDGEFYAGMELWREHPKLTPLLLEHHIQELHQAHTPIYSNQSQFLNRTLQPFTAVFPHDFIDCLGVSLCKLT